MPLSDNLQAGWGYWQRKIILPADMIRKLEQERRDAQVLKNVAERLGEEKKSITRRNEAEGLEVGEWPLAVLRSGEPCLKLINREQIEAVAKSFDSLFAESDRRQRARTLVTFLRGVSYSQKWCTG